MVDFEFIQDSFVSCIEASHYVTIPNEEMLIKIHSSGACMAHPGSD